MIDEAHFRLNEYVNKQSCHIWSNDNLLAIFQTPLHPHKVIVWNALSAEKIIGPHFIKNEAGRIAKVIGERYRALVLL